LACQTALKPYLRNFETRIPVPSKEYIYDLSLLNDGLKGSIFGCFKQKSIDWYA